jgi:hypothetical protein
MKAPCWAAEREWRIMVPLLDGHSFPTVSGEAPRVAFPIRTEAEQRLLAAVFLGPRSALDIAASPYRSRLGIAKEIAAILHPPNIELGEDEPSQSPFVVS